MMIGILIGSIQPTGLEGKHNVDTPYGEPSSPLFSLDTEDISYRMIARHGIPASIPPHKVNHRANVWALKEAGAEAIISICSTGALNKDVPVPIFAVPEDYIDLSRILTFHDDRIHHSTPVLDPYLSDDLATALSETGIDHINGGVYIQTSGPRLETKAEVRMMSSWADFVGMNLASEASLCSEMDIPVAGLISVDNYANGVVDGTLDFREILMDAKSNWIYVRKVLGSLKTKEFHGQNEVIE